MAKDGPVTVLAADGKSKAAVIAIPRVDAEGRVTLGSVEQTDGDRDEPPTTY
jgi:predicted aspartyl protease